MTKKILRLEDEDLRFLSTVLKGLEDAKTQMPETGKACYDRIKKQLDDPEKQWITWLLSEDDIIEVAELNDLLIEGIDLDLIADKFQDGIISKIADGYDDWTEVLERAIEEAISCSDIKLRQKSKYKTIKRIK